MFDTSNPNMLMAFVAGVLSFLSPCCLPLYPSYISYLTGISYEKLQGERDNFRIRRTALVHSIFFVIGFSIIFVALGFGAGAVGKIFNQYKDLIRQIGGIIIIVMGLFLTGAIKWESLLKERKWHLRNKPAGYIGSVLVGVSFSAGWTPCIGPILASVLAIAATDPANGVGLMSAYSLGFAIPFLILAYSLGSVRWLLKYSSVISRIGGIVMVIMGFLLLTNAMTVITIYMIKLFGGFTGF
ncbi:cytochrome c biogenesis CcdA family protein [Effusibacillus dendaii]|uniref:Cytochrome C biogenesis protein CcdA n=1 Tax=Effusibacillus dendaii TaxID=2743772 RepID=A0A7I8DE31_9BACL|nr:cytochrome c biogenesis protein CcdA [Effusibacillus dendaii]BCJ88365.1 cytochrome C biogenesis protein CcdA [Effusibacillus dendaii]